MADKRKTIQLKITPQLHKRLKRLAIELDRTLVDLVTESVIEKYGHLTTSKNFPHIERQIVHLND